MKIDIAKRKSLGAFYTPSGLSDILCDWAIRERTDTVLEPSFGGCGFLTSAARRLEKLKSPLPQNNIFGCDIDPDAFNHLSRAFGDITDLSRFALGNFLDLNRPVEWPAFDVVIGNPPYLPYRKIDPAARCVALETARAEGINLDLRSSLWAYFVILGATYLKVGGRCAWVLPGSFLFSHYSQAIRSFVASRFARSRAFLLKERLFLASGTEEQTVILLADGYDPKAEISDADISLSQEETLQALCESIGAWRLSETDSLGNSLGSCGDSVLAQVTEDARTHINSLRERCLPTALGSMFDIRIGLVTGNNKFFVVSEEQAASLGVEIEDLSVVLSKFTQARGISLEPADVAPGGPRHVRKFLVSADLSKDIPAAVKAYLNSYDSEAIAKTSTFRKRKVWSMPDDGRPPFAFLPVMHHAGPRLVLNHAKINCTNTIHRAFLKPGVSLSPELVTISMLTSFSQISAEIVGRRYGAGVLKHEPREADMIDLLLPKISKKSISTAFERIDTSLRRGESSSVMAIADELIYGSLLGQQWKATHRLLSKQLVSLRKNRSPKLN